MAQIPDTFAQQTVMPEVNVPDALQRIPAANAEAFGGAAARGQERLGAGEEQAAAGGFSALKFWNEAQADHASNEYMDRVGKILHGDPTKMVQGPDGTMVPDTGYMGLQGRAALDARAGVEQQISDLQKELKGGLLAPAANVEFDRMSNRYRAVTSSQIGTHADTQAKTWMKETAQGTIKVNAAALAADPDNPEILKRAGGEIVQSYLRLATLAGAKPGDAVWQNAQRQGDAAVARARILAVGATDAVRGDAMTEQYKKVLGEDYHVLKDHFRARSEEEGADGAGVNVFREVTGGGGAPPVRGISPKLKETRSAIESKLQAQGIALNITSEYRDEKHNREAGGARDSTHMRGDATDVALSGKTEAQKQAIVEAVLSQPNVTGFGYYPNSDSIHFDVGHASKTAWGQDQTTKTIGTNWPAWMKEKVGAWQGAVQTARADSTEKPTLNAPPDLKEPEDSKAKFARQTEEGIAKIDAMGLSPKAYTRTMRAFREAMATHELSENLKDKAAVQAVDRVVNDVANDLANGDYAGAVNKIRTDPALNTPQAKEHKLELLKQAAAASGNPQLAVDFGPGWLEASRNVLKRPGEEGYIGDAMQILKMGPAGTKQLTEAGMNDVLRTRALAAKDIDQHGIQQTRASMMEWAKSQMVVDHEMLYPGMHVFKDQRGLDAFNAKFVPKVNAAYAAYMQKPNANPLEFWTEENIRGLMQGIRSQKEIQEEKLRGSLAAAQPEDTSKAAIPAAPAGVNANAWDTVVRQPPMSEFGKAWPVKKWGGYLSELMTKGTDKDWAEFDQTFGAAGYTAADLKKRLTTAPAAGIDAPELHLPVGGDVGLTP